MFGTNPVSTYMHAVIAYLPLVFVAIIIVIIAAAVAAAAKALIENSLGELPYAKVLGNVVSGLILAFGIIAALDQLHVATNVVNAVLYAALAALVGVVIVAVGGGGIKTMSSRWESVADKYDEEKPKIAASARSAPSLKGPGPAGQGDSQRQRRRRPGRRLRRPPDLTRHRRRQLTAGHRPGGGCPPGYPAPGTTPTELKEHHHDHHAGPAEHGRPHRR